MKKKRSATRRALWCETCTRGNVVPVPERLLRLGARLLVSLRLVVCSDRVATVMTTEEGASQEQHKPQTRRNCRILEILHYTCPAEPDESGRPRYSCYTIPRTFNVFV